MTYETQMGTHDTRVSDFFQEEDTAVIQNTNTVDVVIIDDKRGYNSQIPSHVAEDSTELEAWLQDWADSYIHITDNPDQITAILPLHVIDTNTKNVLYDGGIEIAATFA